MQFTVDRVELTKTLAAIAGVSGRASMLPVYAHTLIEASEEGEVVFRATDGDAVMYRTIHAEVGDPGKVLLPIDEFRGIAKRARTNHVVVERDDPTRNATVRAGRFEAKLNGLQPMDFTDIRHEGGEFASLPLDLFKEAFDRVKWAVLTESGSNRMERRGVYVRNKGGVVSLEATTGHVLARVTLGEVGSEDEEVSLIVPPSAVAKTLTSAARDGAEVARLSAHDNYFIIEAGALESKQRLISGDIPATDRIWNGLSSHHTYVEIDREELLGAAERVGLLSGDSNGIDLTFSGGGSVDISSGQHNDRGQAEDSLECTFKSDVQRDEMEVCVNYKLLTDALGAIPTDSVRLTMRSAKRAIVFDPVGEVDALGTRALVMPMRRKDPE